MAIKTKSYKPTTTRPLVTWDNAPSKLTRKCVFTLIYGDTATGRTTLALTAPGPIALIHSAEKLEGIIQPMYNKIGPNGDGTGGIFNFGGVYRGSEDKVSEDALVMFKSMEAAWYDAFSWARTIILDTDTDAWELIRLAEFGAYKPAKGRVETNYGPVNARWKSMFRNFRQQETTNITLIGKTADEYKGGGKGTMGQRTGRTIRVGQKDIPFMADIIIRTNCELMTQKFSSVIEKGWWNSNVMGVELVGEASNFLSIMGLITGETGWTK